MSSPGGVLSSLIADIGVVFGCESISSQGVLFKKLWNGTCDTRTGYL
jgi:hypothetical protein